MSLVYTNMLLQYIPKNENDNTLKIRMIWISPNLKYGFYIETEKNYCIPKIIEIKDIELQIEEGSVFEISDSYAISIDENSITEDYKKIRDRNWEVAQYLWNSDEPQILFKAYRSKCIEEAAEKFKIGKSTVERIMIRFWQRGMNKNALLPDYSNSGARGEKREAGDKKRGRPRKYISISEGDNTDGINVDDKIEKIIKSSIDLFYRKKEKLTLKETYDKMLQKFFSDVVKVNGKERAVVWDRNRIPSIKQFYYVSKKYLESDIEKNIVSRFSDKEFMLKYRKLHGDSTSEAFGPGSKYQIDATIADIYLVSTLNRNRIIGRPIVYGVIDVYTRMIVGIYVGLEGPSWIGAMMALQNTASNKVEFCRQYGIEISNEEWPCEYLPETILADRGEFEGYQVENLINNLGIKIENTAPYRGDMKGIVERRFRTINEKIKHMAPGAIERQYRERGDRDYRLEAKINIVEFTEIIIYLVLAHNKSIIEGYNRERAMIVDEVKPIPIDMWNWGIQNRKSRLIKKPVDIIMLNLLPKGNASISRRGIRFSGLYYSCEQGIQEQWFIKSSRKTSTKIVYDPRNMENIYIPQEKGTSYIKCSMLSTSENSYKSLSYEEIIFQQELEKEMKNSLTNSENQNKAYYNSRIEEIIESVKKRKIDNEKISDSQKIKGIRANRIQEKETMREVEAIELGKRESVKAEVINLVKENQEQTSTETSSPGNRLALLRKERDKARGK